MLLRHLQPHLRATIRSFTRPGPSATQTSLDDAFAQLSVTKGPALTFVRHASHQQQGAVNKAKDGPGKRLGAKKSGGESASIRSRLVEENLDVERNDRNADEAKNNMSSQATSYSANGAHTGFQARIALWDAITQSTPLSQAT
jgi:hypothetical protein